MPGTFGFETPQEAQARVAELFRQQRLDFSQSALAQTTGGRAGQALGQIFGGSIRKFLDTRAARKGETQRLIETTGLSVQEARQLAKENVAPDFKEVRKAKKIQTAGISARELIEELAPKVGIKLARASGLVMMAIELRKVGMPDRATELTLEAAEIRQAEELRLAELDGLKARTAGTRASTEDVGDTPLTALGEDREELMAQLETTDDPKEAASIQRRLDLVEQDIAFRLFKIGSTPTDLILAGLTKPTANKLQQNLIDAGEQLDLLASIGETFKPEFLTFAGNIKAGAIALAQRLSIPVSQAQKQFLVEQSAFKRNSIDGLNRYIKLITGAQMSEAEADRLRKGFPDPEHDSESQFLSKYVEVVRQLMAFRGRAQASLETGSLTLLPTEFKKGLEDAGAGSFGADVGKFTPSKEEVIKMLGLQDAFRIINSPEAAAVAAPSLGAPEGFSDDEFDALIKSALEE